MIASFMAYALLVGALLALAGDALDRAAAAQRWPRRFVWAAVVAAAIIWPAASALRHLWPSLPAPPIPLPLAVQPIRVLPAGDGALAAAVDRTLVVLWGIASAALLLRLAAGVVALRRARRGWAIGDVDGTAVRLSTDVGPAVVGLRSMDVVLPEWVLSLDDHLRAVVLKHEEEHRTARDPVLLFAAALGSALMPWNPALWYAARRLRLAIELDCDARVLREHPSTERYGLLMLAVAQRRTTAPSLFAATLFESTTQLERRILAMRPSTRRLASVTGLGGALVATAALALACSLQSDKPTAPAQRAGVADKLSAAKGKFSEFKITKEAAPLLASAAPRYPDALRTAKVEGEVLAMFVVNPDGTVDPNTLKVVRSSHELFTQSVKSALPQMRFSPAEVDGRRVRQLVTMPFRFSLTR